MCVAVGLGVTLSLLPQDLPVASCAVFGTSFALLGLTFAAVAALAAQITENTRVASGTAGAVLGLSFVLRAAGDVGDGTLSWFSPIGWAQKARPFAGDRWWPFLLLVAAAGALVATARALAARRDLGGALIAPRPGPASAPPGLGRPLGLALRLQRSALVAWTAGLVVTGVAYGSIADSVDDFVADNEALSEMLARVQDVDLTEAYLATSFRILAVIASGFAIAAVLRVRSEEASGRAEPILATPVSRPGWAGSHLVMAAGGSVVLLAGAGLATGVSYGAIGGGMAEVPGLLGAALVYLPAMWVMSGFTAALVGFVPRASGAAWAGLGLCLVVGMLADLLGLPGWVVGLSPFEHVPLMPADGFSLLPLAVLTALGAALTAAGLSGLARRDIG
jgi:ABC-2 type transport system permease protein